MILFFYGTNDYLISRKVRELKDKYLEKAGGDLNLTNLDGQSLEARDFLRQVQAIPLLATSRLVVIDNILKNKDKAVQEVIKNSLESVPASTVILFVEQGMPDKRLGLFKALNKPKVAEEFKAIEPYKLPRFIVSEVEARGGKIEKKAADLLAEFSGDNLWQLSNEIEKLLSFATAEIKMDDVEILVARNITSNIFAMIDNLARGQKAGALTHLEALLESGEPPLRILSLINYQYRTIAQIKEASKTTSNQFAISKITKLAPFQISKFLLLSQRFKFADLAGVYEKIARVDFEIKTGKIEGEEGLRDLVLEV